MKQLQKLLGLVALLIVTCIVFGSGKAHAATLNVVAGTDAIDVNGQCQLSEAITNINDQAATKADCVAVGAYGSNDTINLPVGTITLSADLSPISQSVNIIGQGMTSSTINGDSQFIPISLFNPGASSTMTDFKITSFKRSGIFAIAQNVTLNRIDVDGTGSIVDPSIGGGLVGGIYLAGDLSPNANYQASDIHIHDITASAGFMVVGFLSTTKDGNTSTIDIQKVTIARLHNIGNAGFPQANGFSLQVGMNGQVTTGTINAQIRNVTIDEVYSDHSISSGFGAIAFAQGGTASTNITTKNVTVTRVQGQSQEPIPSFVIPSLAFYTAGAAMGNGDIANAVIDSQNVLLANNTSEGLPSDCTNIDLSPLFGATGTVNSTIASQGHNLADDNTCTSFNQPGDQQNLSNLGSTLDELALNGGITPTRALLPSSPAIGAGIFVLGISTDQRGIARPSTNPDAGAYQHVLGATTSIPSAGNGVGAPNTGLGGSAQNDATPHTIAAVLFVTLLLTMGLTNVPKRKNHA